MYSLLDRRGLMMRQNMSPSTIVPYIRNAGSASISRYTPVYTLVPCEYRGQCGLWCMETNTFYGNSASSGTLTVSN